MLRTCSGQLVSLLMCVMGRERCSWGLWGPLGSLVVWWRWPHSAGGSRVVLGLQRRVPASAHFQVISPVPLWLFPQATEMIFTLGETWWWKKKKTHQKARKILKPSLSETFHFFIFFFPQGHHKSTLIFTFETSVFRNYASTQLCHLVYYVQIICCLTCEDKITLFHHS